jgi:hypothetical protein
MRSSGGVRRLRSPEECVAMIKLNTAAYAVAAVCLGIGAVVMGMAWKVLGG